MNMNHILCQFEPSGFSTICVNKKKGIVENSATKEWCKNFLN